MVKKFIYTTFCLFINTFLNIFAQKESSAVEMADTLRANGKIYIVVITILIILVGLLWYVWQTDKKISKLEKDLKD
jgi:uncharacterized membrane protein YwaF